MCGAMPEAPKRGRGRPAIGAPLTVRLPDDVRHAITAEAERQDIAEAEVVRRIVVAWADTVTPSA